MKGVINLAIELNKVLLEGKREEYLNYIDEHIENVNKVWTNILMIPELRYIINGGENNTINEDIICQNISMHDKSKYSEEEFEPYRKNFFPVNNKEKEDNLLDFQIAWQHHKNVNKHHWDYWHERGLTNEMPLIYVVEMFCDHAAMSMKFGGTALEWFKNQLNNHKIVVGDKQKELYLKIAEIYYQSYK